MEAQFGCCGLLCYKPFLRNKYLRHKAGSSDTYEMEERSRMLKFDEVRQARCEALRYVQGEEFLDTLEFHSSVSGEH